MKQTARSYCSNKYSHRRWSTYIMVKIQNSHEKLQDLDVTPLPLLSLLLSLRDSFCTFPHISPNDQLLPDVPTAGSHIPLKSLFLFRPYFTCSEKQFQTCRFSSLEPLNTRFTGKVPVVSEEHAEWNIISAKLF